MGKQKAWRKKGRSALNAMTLINPDAAGIDIGSEENWVAIPADRTEEPIKKFGAFSCDIEAMAAWLKGCKITTVAMESTGVYWIPVYDVLENKGFEVLLVNARDIRNVPGRKSDIKDCQWIQQLHSFGLLRGSFRPKEQICQIRAMVRQRDTLVKNSGEHVQRMQKALTQMNIQIHKVISDITGTTGLAIIDQILQGERDPEKLTALRDPRIKTDPETIKKALIGNWREEHIFTLRQELEAYRFFIAQIGQCEGEIQKRLVNIDSYPGDKDPKDNNEGAIQPQKRRICASFDMHSHFRRITGIDLSWVPGFNSITVMTLFSEIGVDLGAWKTERHFTSWLGLAPNHKISGGKILSRKSRHVVNRAANALRLAAQAVQKTPTALGAFCRRIKSRLGPAKAIAATARKLACIYYRCLTQRTAFVEIGVDYYERKYRHRIVSNLIKKAKLFGLEIKESISQSQIIDGIANVTI
jgi:transposase